MHYVFFLLLEAEVEFIGTRIVRPFLKKMIVTIHSKEISSDYGSDYGF